MKKSCLIIVLSALLNLSLHAQEEVAHYHNYDFVIAQSGLNMRSAPNLTSSRIMAIPFGEQVQVLEEVFESYDTIDYFHEIWIEEDSSRPVPVADNWVKVAYQGTQGYVFSGLLGPKVIEKDLPEQVLIEEGWTCDDRIYKLSAYTWYGLYKSENRTLWEEVDLTVYCSSIEMAHLEYATNKNKGALIIMGLKKKANLASLNPKTYHPMPINLVGDSGQHSPFYHPEFELTWEISDFEDAYKLQIQTQGKVIDFGFNENVAWWFENWAGAELLWYGDLNGDGQIDYLFESYNSQTSWVLYVGDKEKGVKRSVVKHRPFCC